MACRSSIAVVVIDADSELLGKYRKSHIPDGPGYQETIRATPASSFLDAIRSSRHCKLLGPVVSRGRSRHGAAWRWLLYPKAIGSEHQDATLDSQPHWTRVMQGRAGANLVLVIASNRIGRENGT